jgi:6-phosphofructokinase 2
MTAVLTLTLNPTIDKSAEVDHVTSEKKLRCRSVRYEPGGGGLNVSRAIRQLGGESQALYLAGGLQGRRLQGLLDQEALDHRSVEIGESIRENLIIYEENSGEQYRFGMPGPEVSEPEWRALLDAVWDREPVPDYLVASGSLPPGVPGDFYGRLARQCREKGIRMILDTSGDPLVEGVREGVFLIKPNVNELKTLAGMSDFDDESHLEEPALKLTREGGAEVVVASLGAAGAMLVWQDQCQRLRAPTVSIKSKVGAGDSMVAGIVLALARGEDIVEAARFGVAAGAAAVMTPGTELCRRDDTERLYRTMKANPQS